MTSLLSLPCEPMDSHILTDAQIESLRDELTAGSRFHPPVLEAGACINAHHRGAGCTLCADACPTRAIHMYLGAPQLDGDLCIGCGLCSAACPMEAWHQESASERTLVEVVSGLPDTVIALVCALHPQPARTSAPATTVVRHRRCLAAVDLGDLLALAARGNRTVWLDDTPCATCPLQAGPRLQARIDLSNDLLDAYGLPPALYLTSGAALEPLAQALPVVDDGEAKLSRRSFLAALGRARSDTRRSTSTARARLLAALPPIEDAADVVLPDSGAPFGQIAVDAARCSGCGMCAYFCPTDALVWSVTDPVGHDDPAAFALGFAAAACIDCPICMLACPEDAILRVSGVTAAALTADAPASPLVSGRLVACETCGVLTAEATGTPRCHVCRHAPAPVTSLHDGAGLMADLLGRIPPPPRPGAASSTTCG